MAHIKEPKGVDFIIKSEPLTDDERAAISEYIRNYKPGQAGKRSIKKRTSSRTSKA